MVDLRSTLRSAATAHIAELIEELTDIDQEEGIDCCDDSVFSYYCDVIQRLIDVLTRLATFDDALNIALKIFKRAFFGLVPFLWKSGKVVDYKISLVFDEVLLALFKIVSVKQGISGLQKWRSRIFKQPLGLEKKEYAGDPFLSRSIQFASETIAETVTKTLVDKVVGSKVPQELWDMIYAYMLHARDVVKVPKDESTWAAITDPAAKLKASIDDKAPDDTCCDFALVRDVHYAIYWSASEHRYVRFHVVSPEYIDARYASMEDGGVLQWYNLVFVRCRGALGGGLSVDGILTENRPSFEWGSNLVFEVNHGITKRWCDLSKKKAGRAKRMKMSKPKEV
jgi:hypothetical protein